MLLLGTRGFGVEGFADGDVFELSKNSTSRARFPGRAFGVLVLDDFCIGAGEVEAHAAVFGFHA